MRKRPMLPALVLAFALSVAALPVAANAEPEIPSDTLLETLVDDSPDAEADGQGGVDEGASASDEEEPDSSGTDLKPNDSSQSLDEADLEPFLSYSAHVQNIGWQNYVTGGKLAGTSGKSLRIEALRLNLENAGESGIRYRAHVQAVGWQNWSENDEIAGSVGLSRRVEALQIELQGDIAQKYDVWYRVHVQNIGWMGWTSNGKVAGTTGKALRIEGIQIVLLPKGADAPGPVESSYEEGQEPVVLSYRAHVQNIGWQGWFRDGKSAGTTGMGLSVEAIETRLSGIEGGEVLVKAHCQDLGWLDSYAGNDSFAGTTGRGKRVEAIRAKLSDSIADQYDLYYRVHVQNFGWLDWANNDQVAGTTGFAKGIEAVEFKLVEKGAAAPGSTDCPYISMPALSIAAHVQNIGWQSAVGNGGIAGTTGKSLRVEALKVSAEANGMSGGIEINSHVQNIGWQGFKPAGEVSGTEGKGYRVEAVQIRLTGEMAERCDVWYRVHAEKLGWMGWTKNGASAGSSGCAAKLEAVQVKVVAKGAAAPGSTFRPFTTDAGLFSANPAMYGRAQLYTSATNWLLMVDAGNNRVGVFNRSGNKWLMYDHFLCSSGASRTPTIRGQFTVGSRGYSFGDSDHTCYYWTQIRGDYLFHSVLYVPGTNHTVFRDGRLGMHLSAGCVRLDINKAKWIHDNIPSGTKVVIYN